MCPQLSHATPRAPLEEDTAESQATEVSELLFVQVVVCGGADLPSRRLPRPTHPKVKLFGRQSEPRCLRGVSAWCQAKAGQIG